MGLVSISDGFTLDDFSMGLDWTSRTTNPDPRSLLDAKNFNITRSGVLEKRSGVALKYSTAYNGARIYGLYEYRAPNGTDYIVVGSSTKIGAYYSAAWNDWVTGLTASKNIDFATHQGYCFYANGTDDNGKILNTTSHGVGIAQPSAVPTLAEGAVGVLDGTYNYVYAYKRSADTGLNNGLIGNYSDPAAANITVASKKVNVTITHPTQTDSEIDKVVLYRTLELGDAENSSTVYFKVTEIAALSDGSTEVITDNTADGDLTTLAVGTNTVPPKCKYLTLFKDRMFYANCPDEDDGESLVVYSKSGVAEAAPSTNYEYFDREDGEPVTGITGLTDYLVVFKRNKIFAIEGDFVEKYTIGGGVGCVDHRTIINLKDKCVFLSEEGWKLFDGRNAYDISGRIDIMAEGDWFSPERSYSAVYYPSKKQFMTLMTHHTADTLLMCGHFIQSLNELGTTATEPDVSLAGFTYHSYPNNTFGILATYTDSQGVTRIMGGDDSGFIFNLDTGSWDEGNDTEQNDIACAFSTGWFSMSPQSMISKTIRMMNFTYATDSVGTISYSIDTLGDSVTDSVTSGTFTGTTAAAANYSYANTCWSGMVVHNSNIQVTGTDRFFKLNVSNNNQQKLGILGIELAYRSHGARK